MKILVAVKRVVDYNVEKFGVKADNSASDLADVKMSMNPSANRRGRSCRRKRTVICRLKFVRRLHRPSPFRATAHRAGSGADRAILIESAEDLTSWRRQVLKAVVDKESRIMVILGKQAIDSDNNQTGQEYARCN